MGELFSETLNMKLSMESKVEQITPSFYNDTHKHFPLMKTTPVKKLASIPGYFSYCVVYLRGHKTFFIIYFEHFF